VGNNKRTRRSSAELRRIALAIHEGAIVTSRQVPKHLWLQVFMPVAFLPKRDMPADVDTVYGELRDSSPWFVNDYPTFLRCYFLSLQEWRAIAGFLKELNHWVLKG
jgi:hypothetical protein